MSGINVNYIAGNALKATYPQVQIQWYKYTGQTNVMGIVTTSYNAPVTFSANVQLANAQELQLLDGYNSTKIYKKFWINNQTITGLDRNISSGGDYLVYNSLTYKIVQVIDQFNTGWVKVFGVESNTI